ncbi:MAG: DUF4403 family protein [Flavobacteriales bacterium]|nr:DUF4403 family protein [Flavobacteriales bacterium]
MRRNHKIIIQGILLLVIAFLMGMCSGRRLIPVFQEETVPTDPIQPPVSLVSLQLTMPYENAARALDKALGEVIYEDPSFDHPDNDDLKLRVTRTAPTVIRGFQEFIQVEPTVRVQAAYRYKACDFCPSLTGETDFEARLRINSRLRLLPEWRIKSESAPGSYEFLKKPYLSSGILKFNISFLVRRALDDNLPKLCRMIDEFVYQRSGLQQELSKSWSRLSDPVLVNDSKKLWLLLDPQRILVSPLQCDSKALRLQTALETVLQLRLAHTPPQGPKNPMPLAVIASGPLPPTQLFVPVSVSWTRLDTILSENIQDTIVQLPGKKKVYVREVHVRGNDRLMMARIKLGGDIEGTLWLGGEPAIDTLRRTFFLNNLDYTLKTRHILAGPLSVLLKGPLLGVLRRRLVWNYAPMLEEVNNSITSYLKGYSYGNLARISGAAKPVRVEKLVTNAQGLALYFQWEGRVNLELLHVESLF